MDEPGWSFDARTQAMKRTRLGDEFDFDEWYALESRTPPESLDNYDLLFCMHHGWGLDLPWSRTLGSIGSQWVFSDQRELPGQREFNVVNRYARCQLLTRAMYEQFRPHCPGAVYLANPVDVGLFHVKPRKTGPLVACWNGNARHISMDGIAVKGFHDIIEPACCEMDVPLHVAEYTTGRRGLSEMPEFYRQANLAVCMSLYEGASNSVLEAMAMGLAVVATDVGNHRELIESQMAAYGRTGIMLVDRSVEALMGALGRLQDDPDLVRDMGEINRAEINRAWSWDVWVDHYRDFFTLNATRPPVNVAEPSVSAAGPSVSDKVTVFFVTTGGAVARRSMAALREQDCTFRLDIIENVAPMSAAFQQMLDRCETPYFIQVDEDMVMKPGAVREMLDIIERTPDDVFMYASMLWDEHLVRGIFGVKIYRTALMKLVPYRDVQSCEQDHFKRLQEMGYRYMVPGWDDATLRAASPQVHGLHGTSYGPRAAYERYLDLTEKYRDVGGGDWFALYPWVFLQRLTGRDILNVDHEADLWSFVGSVCGLFSDVSVPRGEKDFTKAPRGYGELRAHLVSPPREAIIYSTGRCNAMCPHCLRQAGSYGVTPDFTPELTERLLRVFPTIDSCCVAGFGEPCLNHDLEEIVGILRARNVCVGVVTNGLAAVQDGRLHPGLAQASYVSFSLNALDGSEHEAMYGVRDGWARACRGVEVALAAGVPTMISFIITKQTWRAIPEYLRLAKSMLGDAPGSRVALVNILPHADAEDAAGEQEFLSRVITTDDGLELAEHRALADDLKLCVFAWPVPIDPHRYPSPGLCPSPFVRVGVDGNGNISGCSRIMPPSPSWGNLDSGTRIWWLSTALRDLRRGLAGALPLRRECRHCFGNWVTM
jgi:uncharacterized radical SAM superfamily Fe-S cluster-containing enzyme